MGRWVGQKITQKIRYPLWMAPKRKLYPSIENSYEGPEKHRLSNIKHRNI